jgi:hypothetical protein
VSVPGNLDVKVEMVEQNWAFGEIAGAPRGQDAGEEF